MCLANLVARERMCQGQKGVANGRKVAPTEFYKGYGGMYVARVFLNTTPSNLVGDL